TELGGRSLGAALFRSGSASGLIVLEADVDRRRILAGEAEVHVAAPPVVQRLDRAVEIRPGGEIVPGFAGAHDLCGGVVGTQLIGPAAQRMGVEDEQE